MWTKPKIDWDISSRFDMKDYNRIKNNLDYLKELFLTLQPAVPWQNMGTDKGYTDYPYADDINRFEDNLDTLNKSFINLEIGDKKTFYENQPFIDFNELNRIEKGIQVLYEHLCGSSQSRPMLQFTLNGGIF